MCELGGPLKVPLPAAQKGKEAGRELHSGPVLPAQPRSAVGAGHVAPREGLAHPLMRREVNPTCVLWFRSSLIQPNTP